MESLLKLAILGCLLTFVTAKSKVTGADVFEQCQQELQNDENGMTMDKYNGCFLGCVLQATGVLVAEDVEGPQNGSYRVDMNEFHYLFEKEPLNAYAHTCMDAAPLKYLSNDNICDNSINFYGCLEDWLTRDLIYAIYNYYGTKPQDIFQLMMNKNFNEVPATVRRMYNMTMDCSKYPIYWDGQSDVCFNRCMWEQVGLFDKTEAEQDEKFRNLFGAEGLNETANSCKPDLSTDPISRCQVIEQFYLCAKGGVTRILEETITAPFGNPGVAPESDVSSQESA